MIHSPPSPRPVALNPQLTTIGATSIAGIPHTSRLLQQRDIFCWHSQHARHILENVEHGTPTYQRCVETYGEVGYRRCVDYEYGEVGSVNRAVSTLIECEYDRKFSVTSRDSLGSVVDPGETLVETKARQWSRLEGHDHDKHVCSKSRYADVSCSWGRWRDGCCACGQPKQIGTTGYAGV